MNELQRELPSRVNPAARDESECVAVQSKRNVENISVKKQPQAELRLGLPLEAVPAEWQRYVVPAGYERADDVIAIRRSGKVVEIDFDGEILKATRQSRDRMFLRFPDGTKIEESGFDKFMSKVALRREHAREYRLAIARSKEAEERQRKATQEAEELREQERARGERLAASVEEPSATKPRLRNKLATDREPRRELTELDFINPKTMIEVEAGRLKGGSEWQYAAVPKWLNAIEGITKAEQMVYGWMVFRAYDDGVFRNSLFSLARDCRLTYRGILKVVASLSRRGEKGLIYKATSRERQPNDYKFVRVQEMDGSRADSEQSSLWASADTEQRSPRLANGVHYDSEPSSHLNNEQEKKHIKRILAPHGEQRLLVEVKSVVGAEEMKRNGGMWRTWAREDPRALRAAIDDLAVRGDNYHLGKVKNPGAYINERYQFYRTKFSRSDKAMTDLSPDKSLSQRVRESISQAETELPA